jgi:hypothetical protein
VIGTVPENADQRSDSDSAGEEDVPVGPVILDREDPVRALQEGGGTNGGRYGGSGP